MLKINYKDTRTFSTIFIKIMAHEWKTKWNSQYLPVPIQEM